jgi:hypothetical protein
MRFTGLSVGKFWISVKEEYPQPSPSNTANSARENIRKIIPSIQMETKLLTIQIYNVSYTNKLYTEK